MRKLTLTLCMIVISSSFANASPVWCVYQSFNPEVKLQQAAVAPCTPPLSYPWRKISPPLEPEHAWNCVCSWWSNNKQTLYVADIAIGNIDGSGRPPHVPCR